LKKLKGLNKVRLTEAHFIWTEPHSKRLRVSMTIQKEVRGYMRCFYFMGSCILFSRS
jgi:NMD protein affecting ribosome stability and mRNA decay